MLIGALGWAVAFMPVSPSSALRVPDAAPDDPHSPPYLRQPLHDHDDHAVCAPIAGALGVGDALFSDYSVWLQIDHIRICGNLW